MKWCRYQHTNIQSKPLLSETNRARAAERSPHHEEWPPGELVAERAQHGVGVAERVTQRGRTLAGAVSAVVHHRERSAHLGEARRGGVVVRHGLAVAVKEQQGHRCAGGGVHAQVQPHAGVYLDPQVPRAVEGTDHIC